MIRFSVLFGFLMFASAVFAQQDSPVSWSFDAKAQDANTYIVTFTASVSKGWGIYSKDMEAGGPIPTSFMFDDDSAVRVDGDMIEKGDRKIIFDELFEMEVNKLFGTVTYQQTVNAKPGSTLKGYLEFMTCDDKRCLPPTTVDFAIALK